MTKRHQGIKASRHRRIERSRHLAIRTLASSHRGRGFTLVELLVAVVVLLAVILALSRIFATASEVTGIGQATATIMQEAAAIEEQMRKDIANLSPDGFFAIRQVAVPNNVNGDENLLDPALPPDHVFRADQLVFFTDALASQQSLRRGRGLLSRGQGSASRVYWGHAFQLPNARGFDPDADRMHDPDEGLTPWHRGPVNMVRTLLPTAIDEGGTSTGVFQREGDDPIDGTQPPPRNWLLARQAVALVDDDERPPNTDAKTVFMQYNQTARSIFNDEWYGGSPHPRFGWSREIRNGRVNGAASRLGDIRQWIRMWPNGTPRTWDEQRNIISQEAIYYPRAEKRAPSMHRVDQALTNHVIGTAVSDFVVEWTWDDGTGDLFDSQGNRLLYNIDTGEIRSEAELDFPILTASEHESIYGTNLVWWPFGFYKNWFVPSTSPPYESQPEQPWFGINFGGEESSFCNICPDRGVGIYSKTPYNSPVIQGLYQVRANYKPADTVFPNFVAGSSAFNNSDLRTIERWGAGSGFHHPFNAAAQSDRIRVYEAFFGYNRTQPLIDDGSTGTPQNLDELYGSPWDSSQVRLRPENGYTPWPSAIRVTMTLHDPRGRMETGRTVQFVIDLPKRVNDRRK